MYYAQNRIYEDVAEQTLNLLMVSGSGIGANREWLVKQALKGDTTHILFIDEDMTFDPDTLHVLMKNDLPIVGCNYKMRSPRTGFTALAKDGSKRIVTTEESTGLEECYYSGFGFCVVKREVFEKAAKPWFLLGYNTEAEKYTTEDCGFARRLREVEIPWHIDHDASKLVSHIGNYDYNYKEKDYDTV